jgi:hypothetical protein
MPRHALAGGKGQHLHAQICTLGDQLVAGDRVIAAVAGQNEGTGSDYGADGRRGAPWPKEKKLVFSVNAVSAGFSPGRSGDLLLPKTPNGTILVSQRLGNLENVG